MFAWKIEWIKASDKSVTNITDCINLTINKSTEIKNNICKLTLKNSPSNFASDGTTIIGDYVGLDSKEILFNEDDQIKVWATYLDDASEVGTEWYDDDRLLGSFAVKEFTLQNTEDSSRVSVSAADWAYLLFNSVYTFTYGIANKFTAPGVVRNCARKFCEDDDSVNLYQGTDNDIGVYYDLDAKFLSEGGNITDRRTTPTTTLDGALNSSATTINVVSTTGFEDSSDATIVIDTEHIAYTGVTATSFTGCTRGIDDTLAESHTSTTTTYQGFPLVLMSKIWKPLFEWIGEISQTESTNYSSELVEGGTLFHNRAFLFWIDKNNSPHWVYPNDTVDLSVTLGEEGRRSFQLEKSVFDAINFVIYNCGEDMYGHGIMYYWFDDSTEVKALKMRYQPMSKIVSTLMYDDIQTNTARITTNQDEYKQFPSAYTMIPTFLGDANNFRVNELGETARTNVANDTEYNDCLREAAKMRGLVEARKITKARTGLRYSGSIAVKGTNLNPGDLVEVTNPFVGLRSKLLRVKEVYHNISQNSYETTINVEEDITE